MTSTDYLLNGVLVLLVLRQVRTRRMDTASLVLPLAIVAGVGWSYLSKGVPTAGRDAVLIAVLGGAGAALGVAAAMATRVWRGVDGRPWSKAGGLAAALWVIGIGSRMAFSYASSHGAGPAIGHFSTSNHITGGQAWTAALVIMALAEVLGRLAVLRLRAQALPANEPAERVPTAAAA